MAVGAIIACIIRGHISDLFGRKLLCSLGTITVAVAAFKQSFAINFNVFTGGKVLLGLGSDLQQLGRPFSSQNSHTPGTAFFSPPSIIRTSLSDL